VADEGKSLAMTINVSRFLDDRPRRCSCGWIVVSFVVGIVLETFGLNAAMVFSELVHGARRICGNSGCDMTGWSHPPDWGGGRSSPIWLVLRLVNSTGRTIGVRKVSTSFEWYGLDAWAVRGPLCRTALPWGMLMASSHPSQGRQSVDRENHDGVEQRVSCHRHHPSARAGEKGTKVAGLSAFRAPRTTIWPIRKKQRRFLLMSRLRDWSGAKA